MSEPLRIANCSGFYGDRLSAAARDGRRRPHRRAHRRLAGRTDHAHPVEGHAARPLTGLGPHLPHPDGGGPRHVRRPGHQGGHQCRRPQSGRPGRPGTRCWPTGSGCRWPWPTSRATTSCPGSANCASDGHPLAHLDTGRLLEQARRARWCRPTPTSVRGPSSRRCDSGADVVVCPRVTDASLVVGPAAWHHGWAETDWDALAGAVVAGHVIECGPQATGGNYAFFTEVPGLEHPGFPIAEVAADGSSVITKHPGTGGAVTVGTVTAQLLYEIAGHHYPNTDVVARFDTVEVDEVGPDRVRLSGTEGTARPAGREGLLQPARRLAKLDDVRAHRPRRRGQGRPDGALAGRSARWDGPVRRVRRPADPHRQGRRARPTSRPPPSSG